MRIFCSPVCRFHSILRYSVGAHLLFRSNHAINQTTDQRSDWTCRIHEHQRTCRFVDFLVQTCVNRVPVVQMHNTVRCCNLPVTAAHDNTTERIKIHQRTSTYTHPYSLSLTHTHTQTHHSACWSLLRHSPQRLPHHCLCTELSCHQPYCVCCWTVSHQ